jgi:hypothetical protein
MNVVSAKFLGSPESTFYCTYLKVAFRRQSKLVLVQPKVLIGKRRTSQL